MMRRFLAAVMVVPILACVRTRPVYVEPLWGNAPAPIAIEITEVSMERMDCPGQVCVYTRTTFRRDGRAELAYRSGKDSDSSFSGMIDSVDFARLATGLIEAGLWRQSDDDEAAHEDFQAQDILVSAATLCRRQVRHFSGKYMDDPAVKVVDSAAAGIDWSRCCTALRSGGGAPPATSSGS